MKPEIHFDYLEPRRWEGKGILQLGEEMDSLRKRVKKASGYYWDIDDCRGHPALSVLFPNGDDPSINFWNATNRVGMGILSGDVWTPKMSEAIRNWVFKIEEGLTRCQECHKWVKEIKHFSFAGGVCEKCYDPKRHLPPDTRGD